MLNKLESWIALNDLILLRQALDFITENEEVLEDLQRTLVLMSVLGKTPEIRQEIEGFLNERVDPDWIKQQQEGLAFFAQLDAPETIDNFEETLANYNKNLRKDYEAVFQRVPAFVLKYVQLARLINQQKDTAAALPYYKAVITTKSDPALQLEFASTAWADLLSYGKKPKYAKRVLNLFLKSAKSLEEYSSYCYESAGHIYDMFLNNFEKAKKCLFLSHTLEPDAHEPLLGLAKLYLKYEKSTDEAKDYAMQAFDLAPQEADVLFALALIEWKGFQNKQAALVWLRQALEQAPKADYYLLAGDIHRQSDNIEDAKSYYKKALAIEDNNETAKKRLEAL